MGEIKQEELDIMESEKIQAIDYESLNVEDLITACKEKDKQLVTLNTAYEQECIAHREDMQEAAKQIEKHHEFTNNFISIAKAREKSLRTSIEALVNYTSLCKINPYTMTEEVNTNGTNR